MCQTKRAHASHPLLPASPGSSSYPPTSRRSLDEHFCAKWDAHGTDSRRYIHRQRGGATYRIVRYADDFAIMVMGSETHADALWDEVTQVLAPLGLRLSATKTRVCHLDEGFDFLG